MERLWAGKMKKYNVTAQAYSLFDKYKQTVLFNEVICAESQSDALNNFKEIFEMDHKILRIYSIEEINE